MTYGPLDFFDTLVATDWACRFEPFADDELWRLRRYDILADELGQSSFFSQPLRLTVKASAEERSQRLDHAGYEALRSMTMSFRQLWADAEPTRFPAIRSLLRGHALPPRNGVDVVLLLDVLGQRYKAARRIIIMKEVWAGDPLGEPRSVVRAQQVVDDWLSGGPFHSDREKIERVGHWSPTTYEFTFAKAVHEIVAVMWELHIVVMGALGELTAAAA